MLLSREVGGIFVDLNGMSPGCRHLSGVRVKGLQDSFLRYSGVNALRVAVRNVATRVGVAHVSDLRDWWG